MRTKQVRPEPKEFEYELYISKEYDETKDRKYLLFEISTTKEFESFVYNINVSEKIDAEAKTLFFKIEGLSAPVVSLAQTGNAGYQYRLYDYKNTEYSLKIAKQDNETNAYKLKIMPTSGIKIVRQPSKKFIKVITQ